MFKAPIELKIEIAESEYLKNLRDLYPKIFIELNIVKITCKTVTEVWMEYLDIMKRVKKK